MKMLTVAELIRYRMQHERYVHRVGEAHGRDQHGEFRLIAYESEVDGRIAYGADARRHRRFLGAVLVRMHAHCLFGDVFERHRMRCHATPGRFAAGDCEEGRGALIYLHQTSKGFSREDWRAIFSYFPSRAAFATLPESERKIHREIGLGAPDPLRF